MKTFELLKTFFTEEYSKIPKIIKKNNYFYINRIFSIKFPVQSATLSHLKISSPFVVDFWKFIAKKNFNHFGNLSTFAYTPSAKKIKENIEFSKDDYILFCNRNKCSTKEFDYLAKINPVGLQNEIKHLREILSGTTSKD